MLVKVEGRSRRVMDAPAHGPPRFSAAGVPHLSQEHMLCPTTDQRIV